MSLKPKSESEDDMLPEYDFTGAVRGKYYERYRQGTNVILLDPDVARVFRDSTAVNNALRLLVSVANAKASRPRPSAQVEKRSDKAPQPIRRGKRGGGQRRTAKVVGG